METNVEIREWWTLSANVLYERGSATSWLVGAVSPLCSIRRSRCSMVRCGARGFMKTRRARALCHWRAFICACVCSTLVCNLYVSHITTALEDCRRCTSDDGRTETEDSETNVTAVQRWYRQWETNETMYRSHSVCLSVCPCLSLRFHCTTINLLTAPRTVTSAQRALID